MAIIERIHLAIIRAVNEHGSLTAAANHLHLTQSALSHAIRKLENQLGVAVWHREGRSLRLTQSGEYLLAMANRLVPQFLDAEDRLREFSLGERGQLRIGMECHPCYQWLLKVVAPYMAQWPNVDLDVKQKFPTECYCQVSLNTGENFSDLKPSVDLDTHLELYRGFSDTQAIIHTHSM